MVVLAEPEPIVRELILRQGAEKISGDAFARRLGITPAMWSLVRRGKRSGGRKLIDGALRLYPDLSDFYVQDLTISNRNVA